MKFKGESFIIMVAMVYFGSMKTGNFKKCYILMSLMKLFPSLVIDDYMII